MVAPPSRSIRICFCVPWASLPLPGELAEVRSLRSADVGDASGRRSGREFGEPLGDLLDGDRLHLDVERR